MPKTDKKRTGLITNQATDFAAYLYFLRSDDQAVKALKKFFLDRYELLEEKTENQLVLDTAQSHLIIFTNKARTETVEVNLAIADNVIFATILWSAVDISLNRQERFSVVDKLLNYLSEAGVTAVSLSLAMIGVNGVSADLAELLPHDTSYSGKTGWGVIHHFRETALNKRHLYVLESNGYPATPTREFLTKGLVEIDWPLHRLTREIVYYQDQNQTIKETKKRIDKEISEALQRKTVFLEPGQAEITALESEIAGLSQKYSLLASNLHLVREYATKLSQEIEALNRVLEKHFVSGLDVLEDFPGVHQQSFNKSLTQLKNDESNLRLSLESAKAAIDVVHTQVDLFRGSEGMALQKQTKEFLKQNTSLQVAVSVIEVVFIFYYAINAWKEVAFPYKVEELAAGIKFGVVGFFSLAMTYMTHQVALNLEHDKRVSVKLILSIVAVALALALMILVPLLVAQE